MKRDVCWRRRGEVGNVGKLESWNVRREGGCLMWDGMGWDGMEYGRWYGVDCDGLMA